MEIEKIAKSKKRIIDIGIRLNPNINAKARNRIIAYPIINSWEISNKIEVDKEIIKNFNRSIF